MQNGLRFEAENVLVLQEAIFELVSQKIQAGGLKPQAVADYMLGRLLIPGEVSLSALADTLTELGKPVTREQLEGRTTSQIVDFLVSVSSRPAVNFENIWDCEFEIR